MPTRPDLVGQYGRTWVAMCLVASAGCSANVELGDCLRISSLDGTIVAYGDKPIGRVLIKGQIVEYTTTTDLLIVRLKGSDLNDHPMCEQDCFYVVPKGCGVVNQRDGGRGPVPEGPFDQETLMDRIASAGAEAVQWKAVPWR